MAHPCAAVARCPPVLTLRVATHPPQNTHLHARVPQPPVARPYALGVRFGAEHSFPGPPSAVAAVLSDPEFYRELELPDLRLLEVRAVQITDPDRRTRPGGQPVESSEDKRLVLRYEFMGGLDPVALRLLGGERLTWSQELRLFGSSGGRLEFAAEANPRALHGRADFVFEGVGSVFESGAERAEGPGMAAVVDTTLRRLEGELVVALPVIGGMAERRIVPGVLARLDVEAGAVRRRLE